MKKAIQLLRMEAQARRSMSTPNSQTITEFTAQENAKLADEYELAVKVLNGWCATKAAEAIAESMIGIGSGREVNRP